VWSGTANVESAALRAVGLLDLPTGLIDSIAKTPDNVLSAARIRMRGSIVHVPVAPTK
jgi:hypothetical protein